MASISAARFRACRRRVEFSLGAHLGADGRLHPLHRLEQALSQPFVVGVEILDELQKGPEFVRSGCRLRRVHGDSGSATGSTDELTGGSAGGSTSRSTIVNPTTAIATATT